MPACILRIAFVVCFLGGGTRLEAQSDPGPRGGPTGAGSYFPGLSFDEQSQFTDGLVRFATLVSLTGTIAGEPNNGLGPSFNGNSCAMCHSQPAIGGSSPGLTSKQNPVPNPQVALATLDGALNTVPSFITANGPVREARYVSDGGVHALFSVRGRSDAPGCQLAQPDFATELGKHNVVFRIPTPIFGLGLVENTPDATLRANLAATQASRSALGIGGRFNSSGNDGTITRFGWKAQNKSLLIFSGEVYNVEMGVSNEAFPNENNAIDGCVFNATPEDVSSNSADVPAFTIFMRLTAPPTPTTASPSELNGQKLFSSVGCALCHSASLTTARSRYTGMSGVTYHPYSDFALHRMGSNLADGITQGGAGGDEFRTAPLWGVGQRLFFLHDGRTSDLSAAIEAHATECGFFSSVFGDCSESEANGVIKAYNALHTSQKQDILNFLRSL
jgi:CxxC motif-containing protein (DUF1111 family)